MKKTETHVKEIETKIDMKDDFYRYITPELTLEKQEEIAKYILSKNENVYINKDVLNLFQIPKEFKEKINIEKQMMQSHLDKYKKNKLYELTSKKASVKETQSEKTICKRLWEQDFHYKNGERVTKPNSKISIIDFEVPVIYSKFDVDKKTYTNNRCSGNGAVDIVAKDGNILYLIEAKDYKSNESLLRCIAEIKTYYEKIINHKSQDTKYISAQEMFNYSYGASKIIPAIMLFKKTTPYNELKKLRNNPKKYANLSKLAKSIVFFQIEFDNNVKETNRNIPIAKLKTINFKFKVLNNNKH